MENLNCWSSTKHNNPFNIAFGWDTGFAVAPLRRALSGYIKMQRILKVSSDKSDELAVLNKQLIEDEGHSNPMGIAELSDRMKSWLDSHYSCHVLEMDGEILAYCLWRDDAEFYYIRHLYTRRDSRLKGHAKSLLKHLEQKVFINKPVRLEVLVGNSDALSFYEKLGYSFYCHTLEKKPDNKPFNYGPKNGPGTPASPSRH